MAKEIKIVAEDNHEIFVVDGNIYVLCSGGNAAMLKKYEEATSGEKSCAIGPNSQCDLARHIAEEAQQQKQTEEVTVAESTPTPWCDSLDDGTEEEHHNTFSSAVDFLANCSGEDFLELVNYAKAHGNKFFRCVKEVATIINADDCYCSAIIKLARHLGKDVENKAFTLFAREDKEAFIDFWNALQTINFS